LIPLGAILLLVERERERERKLVIAQVQKKDINNQIAI
jgi:hypothetical protein